MDKGDKLVAVNGFQGSIHTKPEKISKCNNHRSFCICVCGKLGKEIMKVMINATSSFSKSFIFKKVSSTLKRKACLKSLFEKPRFRDGLVWPGGLIGELKLRFQLSLAYCGLGQRPVRLSVNVLHLAVVFTFLS